MDLNAQDLFIEIPNFSSRYFFVWQKLNALIEAVNRLDIALNKDSLRAKQRLVNLRAFA